MKRKIGRQLLLLTLLLSITNTVKSQSLVSFADSIRKVYKIPALAYAVVSSDEIIETQVVGIRRVNTTYTSRITDKFHIGSNTKGITAFIAAQLVHDGKLKWETNFLELFPELRPKKIRDYDSITLKDLLTHRAQLQPYTYTNEKPTQKQIIGDNATQRYLLAKYFLSQKPATEDENRLTRSNANYVLAGLMLEKATGRSYKDLVDDLNNLLEIKFGFDYPNATDTFQPYGHDKDLNIIQPFDNYKLNWLLTAGNINSNITDYATFMQLLLIGLKGESDLLTQKEYNNLLFGMPHFSFGWFNKIDKETNHHIAYNEGNAGAFISHAEIIKEANKAYIIFTNAATPQTSEGIAVLLKEMERRYGK